jgi:hypothetical protein
LAELKLPHSNRRGNEGWRAGRHLDLNIWREAFTNNNLLAAIEKCAPTLREVETALERPKARFPANYADGYFALIPQGAALLQLGKVYHCKAQAEMAAGHTTDAYRDIKTILQLEYLLKDEPTIILMLVRVSLDFMVMQTLWDGLARHVWSEEQLVSLQRQLEQMDVLAYLEQAWLGERRLNAWVLHYWLKDPRDLSDLGAAEPLPKKWSWMLLWPRGWCYQNVLRVDRAYNEKILPLVDARNRRVYPVKVDAVDQELDHLPNSFFNILSKILLPSTQSLLLKVASTQTYVAEAATACALERYRLAHHRYPDQLAELVPQFLAAVPNDVVDGQPLRYRLDGEGGFILYSIGWNLADDGGEIAWKTEPSSSGEVRKLDLESGDWAWRSRPITASNSVVQSAR